MTVYFDELFNSEISLLFNSFHSGLTILYKIVFRKVPSSLILSDLNTPSFIPPIFSIAFCERILLSLVLNSILYIAISEKQEVSSKYFTSKFTFVPQTLDASQVPPISSLLLVSSILRKLVEPRISDVRLSIIVKIIAFLYQFCH
jgi:hypothetical protein